MICFKCCPYNLEAFHGSMLSRMCGSGQSGASRLGSKTKGEKSAQGKDGDIEEGRRPKEKNLKRRGKSPSYHWRNRRLSFAWRMKR